jgi:hypothetical protein
MREKSGWMRSQSHQVGSVSDAIIVATGITRTPRVQTILRQEPLAVEWAELIQRCRFEPAPLDQRVTRAHCRYHPEKSHSFCGFRLMQTSQKHRHR